ncbi:MAG: hypothetical protein RR670_00480 [Erysipelotrichaceae bacterium]
MINQVVIVGEVFEFTKEHGQMSTLEIFNEVKVLNVKCNIKVLLNENLSNELHSIIKTFPILIAIKGHLFKKSSNSAWAQFDR